jgi:hypothetical protein
MILMQSLSHEQARSLQNLGKAKLAGVNSVLEILAHSHDLPADPNLKHHFYDEDTGELLLHVQRI